MEFFGNSSLEQRALQLAKKLMADELMGTIMSPVKVSQTSRNLYSEEISAKFKS